MDKNAQTGFLQDLMKAHWKADLVKKSKATGYIYYVKIVKLVGKFEIRNFVFSVCVQYSLLVFKYTFLHQLHSFQRCLTNACSK